MASARGPARARGKLCSRGFAVFAGVVLFVPASAIGRLVHRRFFPAPACRESGRPCWLPRAWPCVTSWPGERERSHALGIYGAVVSAGFASGAVLGGLLAEVTWRLVFFVNAPVGVALLVASMRLLPPDPPGRGGQLDVPGAITVTAGVALLVLVVG